MMLSTEQHELYLAQLKPSAVKWSVQRLIEYLPNNVTTARRIRKELTQEIFRLQEERRTSLPQNPDMEFIVNFVLRDAPMNDLLNRVAFLDKYIKAVSMSMVSGKGLDIGKAKQVPISNFVEFNRSGFASCVWHNEKSPSMKYYEEENKVRCFGCSRSGDVIDVVQALWGCTLVEAVKKLGV